MSTTKAAVPRTVRAELERLYFEAAMAEPEENRMNDVGAARERLAAAQQELAEVEHRCNREVAAAAVQVRAAQVAVDEAHRATLAESAAAWSASALELAEQATAAGTETETMTFVVARNDGTAEPVSELVFRRDRLIRQSAEARARAERLREFARPGGPPK